MKKYGHVEIPLKRIHIELTNVCDFNCTFCPKSEMQRTYGYMDTELAKRLITEIGTEGLAEKITFHVMGEPTLHKNFFEILDHARQEGVKVGLTTNGGGLGGEIGKRLLDYDLHQVDVSLQTPDKKSFALRKAGRITFENYLQGILDFFGAYYPNHKETTFKFRFLVTKFRLKEMEKRKGPVKVISTTGEMRETFRYWANLIYDLIGIESAERASALQRIDRLSSFKWNVVEIYPNIFFETYILDDWGHAFEQNNIREAWAGYCSGMQDHFGILHNGDVTLCCVDFDGKTAVGNVRTATLKEVLSSEEVREIVEGFKKNRPVHPYCKRCLGSSSLLTWLFKPIASVAVMKTLKPFFYKKSTLYNKRP